jgi:hypothetical protein
MTVRADTFKLAERVVWVVLGSILMCMEFMAIYEDRATHDREQALLHAIEQKHFEEVVGGLKNTIAQDQMHFDSTIGRVNDVINTETGGDTFYYLDFHGVSSMVNGKPSPPESVLFTLKKIGRFPLRDVSVTILDQMKVRRLLTEQYAKDAQQSSKLSVEKTSEETQQAWQQSSTTFAIGDLAVPEQFLGGMKMIDGDVQKFDVNLRSLKSQPYRLEMVELRRVGDHWTRALWVEPDSKERPPLTLIDKDFPRRPDGRPDVDWPATAPKTRGTPLISHK